MTTGEAAPLELPGAAGPPSRRRRRLVLGAAAVVVLALVVAVGVRAAASAARAPVAPAVKLIGLPDVEPGAGVDSGPGPDVTVSDAALIDAFVRFAQPPDRDTAEALPLAPEGVELGLGPTLVRTMPLQHASDPGAWLLETDGFRARSGPVSALTVLQEHLAEPDGAQRLGTGLQTSVGEHPHWASPPVPAPEGLADARRVSVQPTEDSITTCLAWFSVDLFLADDGAVVAVTVDLYEP